MAIDKEKILAIRLQELGYQLQGILEELNVLINAPERTKKISRKDEMSARIEANFERKYGKGRKTN